MMSYQWRKIFITLTTFGFLHHLIAQTTGDYKSRQSGAWNDFNTWQRFNGAAWANAIAGQTPTSADGLVEIVSGHLVTITASVTIDQTTISAGAILELTGGTITLNNGTGTDLQINGTYIRSAATSITVGAASIVVANGGIYEHKNLTATPGGSVPTATWQDGSLLKLSAGINNGGFNQSFYDVIVINGTSTLSQNSTSTTMTVRNDFKITGGTFQMKDGGTPYGGVHVLRIKGNFIHSGGTYVFNNNNESESEIRLELEKNWIISGSAAWGGFIASTGIDPCKSGAYFIGSGVQTFSTVLSHDAGELRNRFYVGAGVTGLHEKYESTTPLTAQYSVNGSGGGICSPPTTLGATAIAPWPTSGDLLKTFTINNPSGLTLRDNRNIKDTLYRTVGSIIPELSETISYSSGATLEYNGTAAITTESMEFPSVNGPTNLNINNPGSVTLHESRSLNGKLIFSIDNGLLNTSSCNAATTGAAVITLNDGATVTGAGKTRFVNGIVRKIGDEAFTFPTGVKQGSVYKYAPVQISTPANTTDEYSACYVGANPNPTYNTSSKDASLNSPTAYNVSTCEYWNINKGSGSTDVSVTLSWAYGRSCSFEDASKLIVTHWDATLNPDAWANRGNNGSNTAGPPVTFGWVTSAAAINKWGTFTLAHPNMDIYTLYNNEIYLQGKRIYNTDQLYWNLSESCVNATVFVEQSNDGVRFSAIYNFSVNNIEACQKQMRQNFQSDKQNISNYYRLKAVLPNRNVLYSNTVHLYNAQNSVIKISPNPAISQITLSGIDGNVRELMIFDQLGQMIFSGKTIQSQPYIIHSEKWKSGIYYLKLIFTNGASENYKIIKQ